MMVEQKLEPQQVQTDAIDDYVVYCLVTKSSTNYFFLGSAYSTKEDAEKYKPYHSHETSEYALLRLDLSDITFVKRS